MRKFFAIACAALLALVFYAPQDARAAEAADVSVIIAPTPDILTDGGYTTLRVTIRVNSLEAQQSIQNVGLYVGALGAQGTAIASWASIDAGQSVTVDVADVYLDKNLLGVACPATLVYQDFNGRETSVNTNFLVMQGTQVIYPEAHLSFTRAASVPAALPGAALSFVYVVTNDGTQDVEDVEITDELLGPVGTIDFLRSGERREFAASYTFSGEVTSIPQLGYTNPMTGSRSYVTLDPLPVPVATPRMTATLKVDQAEIQPGEKVTVTCTLLNEGNLPFYDVQLSSEALGMIPGVDELAPGQPYTYSKVLWPASSTDLALSVTAKDPQGAAFSLASDTVRVEVAGTMAQASAPIRDVLSIKVSSDIAHLETPGEVTFTVVVSNTGAEPVGELVLSEISQGEIERMDSMPTGDKVFVCTLPVEADRTFTFTVEAKAEGGGRAQAVAQPVSVAFQTESPSSLPPEVALTPDPALTLSVVPTALPITEPVVASGGGDGLLIALAVVGGLIALCAILLVAQLLRSRRAAGAAAVSAPVAMPPLRPNDVPAYDAAPPPEANRSDEDELTRPVQRKDSAAPENARTRSGGK